MDYFFGTEVDNLFNLIEIDNISEINNIVG